MIGSIHRMFETSSSFGLLMAFKALHRNNILSPSLFISCTFFRVHYIQGFNSLLVPTIYIYLSIFAKSFALGLLVSSLHLVIEPIILSDLHIRALPNSSSYSSGCRDNGRFLIKIVQLFVVSHFTILSVVIWLFGPKTFLIVPTTTCIHRAFGFTNDFVQRNGFRLY